MRWRQIFVFDRLDSLLTMCAVVVGWVVFCMVVIDALSFFFLGLGPLLYIAGATLLVLPVAYAAVAVITFVARS